MEDKDQLQQNNGAHQGNIHQDSDTGTNESGHAGSTLEKGVNPEQAAADKDNGSTSGSGKQSTGKEKEADTLGIP